MSDKPTGGPAFPVVTANDMRGMTLRDWFAGQALAALLNRPEWPELFIAAEQAYALADAMIAERDK